MEHLLLHLGHGVHGVHGVRDQFLERYPFLERHLQLP